MDKTRQDELIAALEKKETRLPCSRCGATRFEIVGESFIPIQENPNVLAIGGPSVPTVIVACSNCGHIWQHAIGSLGLLKRG